MIDRSQYDERDLTAMDEILDSIAECAFGQVFNDGRTIAAAVRLPEEMQMEIKRQMLQRWGVKDRGIRLLTQTGLDKKFRAAAALAKREDSTTKKRLPAPPSVMDDLQTVELTDAEYELAAVVDAVIGAHDVFGVLTRVAVLAADIRPAVWMICRNALRKSFRRDLNMPLFDDTAALARKRASGRPIGPVSDTGASPAPQAADRRQVWLTGRSAAPEK